MFILRTYRQRVFFVLINHLDDSLVKFASGEIVLWENKAAVAGPETVRQPAGKDLTSSPMGALGDGEIDLSDIVENFAKGICRSSSVDKWNCSNDGPVFVASNVAWSEIFHDGSSSW